MPNENDRPESVEKKKRPIGVRGLKQKTDPKDGGTTDTTKDDERPSGRKGEADFMEAPM